MKKTIFLLFAVWAMVFLGCSSYVLSADLGKKMHPSWDVDKDGINDCEKDGSCDDSVDYSLPRGEDIVSYTDNFYKAVNRTWLQSHDIRADQSSVSNFSLLVDSVNEALKTIIDDLESKTDLSREEKQVLDFYRSYVDIEHREALGLEPLKNDLDRIEKASTHRDIAELFAEFAKIHVYSPFAIVPTIDKKDSTRYLLGVTQSGLGLTRDYYTGRNEHSEMERTLYLEFIENLLQIAGFNEAASRAGGVLALETRLAGAQWSNVENRDAEKTYNITNFSELNSMLSNLSLTEQVRILGIPEDATFNVLQPPYLEALNELFLMTEVTTWKDYLRVRYLRTYGDYTTHLFEDNYAEYKKKRGLAQQRPPIWQRAIGELGSVLPMLVGRLYIENTFDEASKPLIEKLVQDIIDEYQEAIEQSTLFSEETREKALEKLHAMEFNIGYPAKWKDYSTLDITGDDIVANLKNIAQFDYEYDLKRSSKPVDRSEWNEAPQVVNAFYSPAKNKFVLLAAILKEPFFSADASEALNYGAIGFVIAHEIGHGFDDQGSRYDHAGNLVDWWTLEDRKKYFEFKRKLISQADHFEYLPGRYLKGELEIGEIIGDLNGAEIALRAYMRIIEEQGLDKEASLKEFFNQMAKTWRNKTRPHMLEMIVNTDTHPVSEFRVNGILKNLDVFHEIYQTKPGDGMYMAPEDRVTLW